MSPDMGAEGKHMAVLAQDTDWILTGFAYGEESSWKTGCAFCGTRSFRHPPLSLLMGNGITGNQAPVTGSVLGMGPLEHLLSPHRTQQARCAPARTAAPARVAGSQKSLLPRALHDTGSASEHWQNPSLPLRTAALIGNTSIHGRYSEEF